MSNELPPVLKRTIECLHALQTSVEEYGAAFGAATELIQQNLKGAEDVGIPQALGALAADAGEKAKSLATTFETLCTKVDEMVRLLRETSGSDLDRAEREKFKTLVEEIKVRPLARLRGGHQLAPVFHEFANDLQLSAYKGQLRSAIVSAGTWSVLKADVEAAKAVLSPPAGRPAASLAQVIRTLNEIREKTNRESSGQEQLCKGVLSCAAKLAKVFGQEAPPPIIVPGAINEESYRLLAEALVQWLDGQLTASRDDLLDRWYIALGDSFSAFAEHDDKRAMELLSLVLSRSEHRWPFSAPIDSTTLLINSVWNRDKEACTQFLKAHPGLSLTVIRAACTGAVKSVEDELLAVAFDALRSWLEAHNAHFLTLCLWNCVKDRSSEVWEKGPSVLANTFFSVLLPDEGEHEKLFANTRPLIAYAMGREELLLSSDNAALLSLLSIYACLSALGSKEARQVSQDLLTAHSAQIPRHLNVLLYQFLAEGHEGQRTLLGLQHTVAIDRGAILQPHNYGTVRLLYDLEKKLLEHIQKCLNAAEGCSSKEERQAVVRQIESYDWERELDTACHEAAARARPVKPNAKKSYVDRTTRRIEELVAYTENWTADAQPALREELLLVLPDHTGETFRKVLERAAAVSSELLSDRNVRANHWCDLPYPLIVPGLGICPDLANRLEIQANSADSPIPLSGDCVDGVWIATPEQAQRVYQRYCEAQDYALAQLVQRTFMLPEPDEEEVELALAAAEIRLQQAEMDIRQTKSAVQGSTCTDLVDGCDDVLRTLGSAMAILQRRRLPVFNRFLQEVQETAQTLRGEYEKRIAAFASEIDESEEHIRSSLAAGVTRLSPQQFEYLKGAIRSLDTLRGSRRLGPNELTRVVTYADSVLAGGAVGPLDLPPPVRTSDDANSFRIFAKKMPGSVACDWLDRFVDVLIEDPKKGPVFLREKANERDAATAIIWLGIPLLREKGVTQERISEVAEQVRSISKYVCPDLLLYDAGMVPEPATELGLAPGGHLRAFLENAFQFPETGEYMGKLGIALGDASQPQASLRLFAHMAKMYPDKPKVFVQYGYAAQRVGDFETAWRSWTRACDATPHPVSFRNLAYQCEQHEVFGLASYYWYRTIKGLARESNVENEDTRQARYRLDSNLKMARVSAWETRLLTYEARSASEVELPRLALALDSLIRVMISVPDYWAAFSAFLEIMRGEFACESFAALDMGIELMSMIKNHCTTVEKGMPDFVLGALLETRQQYDESILAYESSQTKGFGKAAEAIHALESRRIDELQPGVKFCRGRFTVVKRLQGAAGSFGVVIRARDNEAAARECAVKMLRASDRFARDPEKARAHFQREAGIAVSLKHPNIVESYDFVSSTGTGERQYIVMEFIDGQTMEVLMQEEGRFDWKRAVRMTRQVLLGLQYASKEHNLVHRDIAPRNIMVLSDDQVKILDFGHARIGSARQSSSGTLNLKSVYKAPETRFTDQVTSQVDIFAVGIILYELLTGAEPYDPLAWTTFRTSEGGRNAESDEPPRFREWSQSELTDIPVDIRSLVEDMIEYDFRDRLSEYAQILSAVDNSLRNGA